MSSNKSNVDNFNKKVKDNARLTNLDRQNSLNNLKTINELNTLNELEKTYLIYINKKITQSKPFYPPRPPRKGKPQHRSLTLRNNIVDKNTNTTINNIDNTISKLVMENNISILPFTEIKEDKPLCIRNYDNNENENPNPKQKPNTKHILNPEQTITPRNYNKHIGFKRGEKVDKHVVFKSDYRSKIFLISLFSKNYKVNTMVNKYICKRLTITTDKEEWLWYNLTYGFSFHIKYNVDEYANNFNYRVYMKYNKGMDMFDINNWLLSSNFLHLDEEIIKLFENIIRGRKENYWELTSLKFSKSNNHIIYSLLSPLQYFPLYLDYLKSMLDEEKYKILKNAIYYYGNIEIDDTYLVNQLKRTLSL